MKHVRGFALVAAVCAAAPLAPISMPTADASVTSTQAAVTSSFQMANEVDDVVITITDLGDGLLDPKDDLTLSYSIANNSTEPLELSQIQLRSQGYTPTISRQISDWMDGSTNSLLLKNESVETIVAPGQTISGKITLERERLAWGSTFSSWGPRGVEIRAMTAAGDLLSDRSMIVVTSRDKLAPMPISAIVPVTVDSRELNEATTFLDLLTSSASSSAPTDASSTDPSATAEPSSATDEPGVATDDTLGVQYQSQTTNDALRDWNIDGVSLFVDPTVLTDETTINSLRNPAAELHLLPEDDIDISSLAHTGHSDILERKLATSQELAKEWDLLAATDVFLPADSVDQDTLSFITTAGMKGAVVSNADAPLWNTTFYTQSARTELQFGDELLPAVVPNDELSSIVTGTLTTSDDPIMLDALDRQQVALAVSAMTYRQLPNASRPTVVKLSREQVYSADASETQNAVKALLRAPWLSRTGVGTILTDVPDSLYATAPRQSPEERVINAGELNVADMRALDNALDNVERFASIFDNANYICESARGYADSLLSVAWRNFPNSRERQIRGLAPDLDVQSAIRVESSSTINMISESSELPIHVTNPFDLPVNVNVNLKTEDSRLRAPGAVSVRLPAGQTSQVPLPVEAWGSGNLRVKVTVTNEAGEAIGQSQDLSVRVRADWENWGTAIIAGLFAVVLVVGVTRSIRKGRRSDPIDAADFSAAVNATKSHS